MNRRDFLKNGATLAGLAAPLNAVAQISSPKPA
ncbi:MAG: twin-arginine translocation signal domain-containing protein, partial [Acidobacteriota bacterium]|nr:twin-arginine translocation signal domain-containing protein [Acidobacteriota bacterium]